MGKYVHLRGNFLSNSIRIAEVEDGAGFTVQWPWDRYRQSFWAEIDLSTVFAHDIKLDAYGRPETLTFHYRNPDTGAEESDVCLIPASSRGRKRAPREPNNLQIENAFKRIKQTYGISPEEWHTIREFQNGECPGCGDFLSPYPDQLLAVVDHDHALEKKLPKERRRESVRMICCNRCNTSGRIERMPAEGWRRLKLASVHIWNPEKPESWRPPAKKFFPRGKAVPGPSCKYPAKRIPLFDEAVCQAQLQAGLRPKDLRDLNKAQGGKCAGCSKKALATELGGYMTNYAERICRECNGLRRVPTGSLVHILARTVSIDPLLAAELPWELRRDSVRGLYCRSCRDIMAMDPAEAQRCVDLAACWPAQAALRAAAGG